MPKSSLIHTLHALLFLIHGITAQQSTTATIFEFGGLDGASASVISANPSATTYEVICPPENCASSQVAYTVVGGPSTAGFTFVDTGLQLSFHTACGASSYMPTACVYEARSGGLYESTTLPVDASYASSLALITVTEGLEKLKSVDSSPTPTAEGTRTETGAETGTGGQAKSTATTGASASAATSSPTGAATDVRPWLVEYVGLAGLVLGVM